MSIRWPHFLGLAIAVGVSVFVSHPAQALTLVPPTLEFTANAGETKNTSVKIYNEGASPIVVYTSAENFTAADENGTPSFKEQKDVTDLASWIATTPGPISLPAGGRLEVPVTIKVPATADPGSHTAAVFFANQPGTPAPGTVAIQSKVGTLILLQVNGDIRAAAEIAEFKVDGQKTRPHRPVDFLLRVANSGNVHLRPEGTITIRNMIGGTATTLQINANQGAVLPNSIRKFTATWAKDGDGTTGNFFQEIGNEYRNFGLGTYTAEASLTYGQSNQTLVATAKFTIFPWHLLLVAFVGLVIVIFLIIWLGRSYNRMIIRQAEKNISRNTRGPANQG